MCFYPFEILHHSGPRHTDVKGLHLLVSQDHHGQLGLHHQQAVQLRLGHRQAAPVGGVHHVHQNVGLPQVVGPVPPQVLPAADCSEANVINSQRLSLLDFHAFGSFWGPRPSYFPSSEFINLISWSFKTF